MNPMSQVLRNTWTTCPTCFFMKKAIVQAAGKITHQHHLHIPLSELLHENINAAISDRSIHRRLVGASAAAQTGKTFRLVHVGVCVSLVRPGLRRRFGHFICPIIAISPTRFHVVLFRTGVLVFFTGEAQRDQASPKESKRVQATSSESE